MESKQAASRERERLLNLLMTQGPISRLRLAQTTEIPLSNVSEIVEEFISGGWVRESGVPSAGRSARREAIPLEISPTSAWASGIDLHTTGSRLCIVNAAGQVRAQQNFPPPEDIERFATELGPIIQAHARRLDLDFADYTGLGVSVPGIVNPQTGTVSKPNWKWENFALGKLLEECVGSKICIERDVACGAYGERHSGRARNCENFLYILIHPRWEKDRATQAYGYGLAMVVDGRIHRGSNYAAGELDDILALDPMMVEANLDPSESADQERLQTLLDSLARTTASLTNLLDPELVILCAERRLLTEERLAAINAVARKQIVNVEDRRFKLVSSRISLDGLSFGAALLCLHRGLTERLRAPRRER